MKTETKLIASERFAIFSIAVAVLVVAAGAAKPYAKMIGLSTGAISNIPTLVEAQGQIKETARLNTCLNNLRRLDSAKEQAGLKYDRRDGGVVSEQDVTEFIKDGFAAMTCPDGGHYILKALGQQPECSLHGNMSNAEELARTAQGQVDAALKRSVDRVHTPAVEFLKDNGIALPTNAATVTK